MTTPTTPTTAPSTWPPLQKARSPTGNYGTNRTTHHIPLLICIILFFSEWTIAFHEWTTSTAPPCPSAWWWKRSGRVRPWFTWWWDGGGLQTGRRRGRAVRLLFITTGWRGGCTRPPWRQADTDYRLKRGFTSAASRKGVWPRRTALLLSGIGYWGWVFTSKRPICTVLFFF